VYVGHLAVALGASRVRRQVPLVLLLAASQGADWLQLAITPFEGYRQAQLHTHSIPAIVAGAILVAIAWTVAARDWRGALLLAALYLVHLPLDFVTGAKLWWPGRPAWGACLYEYPVLDFVFESLMVVAGWLIYRAQLGARRSSRLAWAMLLALLACQGAVDAVELVRRIRDPKIREACMDELAGN
jgi:membrane-bound metal-dependent hydrolase YbcI (DUF457 family)